MINRVSQLLAKKMFESGNIEEPDVELYSYGFFVLISQVLFFCFAFLIGIAFSCLAEALTFYIAFRFIRKYAGGYHASTETRCIVMSLISIAGCIYLIKISKLYDWQSVIMSIAALSSLTIFFLCPLDTPEKPLTQREKRHFRKISWIVLFTIVIVICVAWYFKIELLMYPCCMSLILEGVLLVSGKTKELRLKSSIHNK